MEQSRSYVELELYVSIQASKPKTGFLFNPSVLFFSCKVIYYRP